MHINKYSLLITLALAIPAAASAEDQPAPILQITEDAATVSIGTAERPVLYYQRTMKPSRPFVRELFTPSGLNVVHDAPSDHIYHHALMCAVYVDGIDFWSEKKTCGRQVPVALDIAAVESCERGCRAGFTQKIEWIAPDGDKKLVENRTIEVVQLKGLDVPVINWRTRMEAPAGKEKVTLSGAHYSGVGMRFVKSMHKIGTHFNADDKLGVLVRSDERVTPTKWTAYAAPVDGKMVTVAMFDHPDNDYKAHFFTMSKPFSYMTATLNLWKEPVDILADKPLNLTYGVVAWDGKASREEIEAVYQQWIKL